MGTRSAGPPPLGRKTQTMGSNVRPAQTHAWTRERTVAAVVRPGASSADLRRIPDRIREEEVAPAGKLPGMEKGNIVLLSGS